jgi:hypothetical protein
MIICNNIYPKVEHVMTFPARWDNSTWNNLNMPTTRKANSHNKHTINMMYGKFYGFALDKQVDRTRDSNKASRHKARI